MRQAADELRAEIAGDVVDVRRQPQHQLHQRLHRRLRLLRLRPDAAARPTPTSSSAERVRRAGPRGGRLRRHRDLHAGRDPPRLHARALRRVAAAGEGRGARRPPARLLADGGPLHVRALRARSRLRVRLPPRAGLGSTPGTAAEVLEDGVRQRISPNKLPAGSLGRDHRGLPPRRPALDLDGDVRPHRAPGRARRAHARRPRAAGADRRDHRVRPALVHPVPHDARPDARDRGDLRRGEPQAHGGVPAGARAHDSRTCRRAG